MEIIFSLAVLGLLFSFVALEVHLVRKWHRFWRIGALLPAAAIFAVASNIAIGILADRTAHNLWPLELLAWSAGGLLYLGVLCLVHKMLVRP